MTNKPQRSTVCPEHVPAELKTERRWVTWRYIPAGEKWTKVPFVAGGTGKASINDPTTWRAFDEALKDYESDSKDGIGCVFSGSPWCGLDLDRCLDDGGRPKPWALPFLLHSYTEVTPSGEGLRVVVRGRWPGQRRQYPQPDGGKVEIYDAASPRYFTVTGRLWNADYPQVESLQDDLDRLARILEPPEQGKTMLRPAPSVNLPDADLLRKARAARNGADFAALYDRGDLSGYNGDASRADLALCGLLAFWADGDPARIDALFRQSALMRDKWDEKHSADGRTYGQLTIERALAGKTEFYQPGAARRAGPAASEPGGPPAEARPAEGDWRSRAGRGWSAAELLTTQFAPLRWVVPDILPEGLCTLAGRPKLGKSWLAMQIACAVGTGGKVLGRDVTAGRALYLALEDGPRRTKERMMKQHWPAAAAVEFFYTWPDLGKPAGQETLSAAVASGGYTLIVVDTISRAMIIDPKKPELNTLCFGFLQRLAVDNHITILLVDHHRKNNGFEADVIDDIIESTARTAPLDAALGLYRKRGQAEATLKIASREAEDLELALEWDRETCSWQSVGTALEARLQGQRGRVLQAITALYPSPAYLSDIVQATGIDKGNVSRYLGDLVNAGFVVCGKRDGGRQPYLLAVR